MKRKLNIFAIIAVVMVAMAALILGSCNADDEFGYYDDGVYTMAEGLLEYPEGNHPVSSDSLIYEGHSKIKFEFYVSGQKDERDYYIHIKVYENSNSGQLTAVGEWDSSDIKSVTIIPRRLVPNENNTGVFYFNITVRTFDFGNATLNNYSVTLSKK